MCSLIPDPEAIPGYIKISLSLRIGGKSAKGFHLQNLSWIMLKKNPYWKQSSTTLTERLLIWVLYGFNDKLTSLHEENNLKAWV